MSKVYNLFIYKSQILCYSYYDNIYPISLLSNVAMQSLSVVNNASWITSHVASWSHDNVGLLEQRVLKLRLTQYALSNTAYNTELHHAF